MTTLFQQCPNLGINVLRHVKHMSFRSLWGMLSCKFCIPHAISHINLQLIGHGTPLPKGGFEILNEDLFFITRRIIYSQNARTNTWMWVIHVIESAMFPMRFVNKVS
jgi:hypothetical protein